MTSDKYLSCAETARLIRKKLKAEYPDTRFGVRSKTYSGGASITVSWTDGPKYGDVNSTVGVFSGAGFDGMIDLKYHVSHWLLPDGSVQHAHSQGTEGSMGSYPAYDHSKPHPEAELVSFGADYVFCARDYSPAYQAKLEQAVASRTGEPFSPDKMYHGDWQSCLPRKMAEGQYPYETVPV